MKTKLLYLATAFVAALLLLACLYITQPAQAASARAQEDCSPGVGCLALSKPAASVFQAKHPLDLLLK